MAINIEYSNDGNTKTISDDFNPRIYDVEHRCSICKEWLSEDEIVWAKSDGTLTVMDGEPYCESDLPEEPEDD